jgi:hypothetical protein
MMQRAKRAAMCSARLVASGLALGYTCGAVWVLVARIRKNSALKN